MAKHRIRLHGPWEIQWISRPWSGPYPGEQIRGLFIKPRLVRMPVDWRTLFGEEAGTVAFIRHFHWPTNLEPAETAWLTFDGVGGSATVRLNGELLGTVSATGCFDVTRRLVSDNRLTVEVTFDPSNKTKEQVYPGGLYATVALDLVAPDPVDESGQKEEN